MGSNIKHDVAVIGMGIKFPNSNSADEYWNNICSKTDNITELPDIRKNDVAAAYRMDGKPVPEAFTKGSYISHIDTFDYEYFGISHLEAKLMDLNQRLFLETAVQAIEDAGYGTEKISNSNTGIYIGYSDDFGIDYKKLVETAEPDICNLSVAGNVHSIIASRISYILNLRGPAMLIDSACSSALSAIHLAVQGLQNGDCEMALVGGSKLTLVPGVGNDSSFSLPIGSSDLRCRAFDDDSDGTGFGEGVAAVLLKPLDKAVKDKDNIYAVIKGSAANQDGTGDSSGITVPNGKAQAEVLQKAWENAGIDPETIAYIETHGTGTKKGDLAEVDGFITAFKKYTDKKQFCAISSSKSSIGHLDHMAGMANFCKAVMALYKKKIPPTLHFKKPNHNIAFENSPVYVNDRVKDWKEGNAPRRCGVSSFGISGTNCHVVLEEYRGRQQEEQTAGGQQVFMLSSKTERGLKMTLKKMLSFLCENDSINLTDLCYTAQCYRDHHACRIAFLVSSLEELTGKLLKAVKSDKLENLPDEGIFYGFLKVVSEKKQKGQDEIYEKDLRNSASKAEKLLMEGKNSSVLKQLCSLYVNLADINWKSLYDKEYTKVHYPAYSFLPERCWVSDNFEKLEKAEKIEKSKQEYGEITCLAKTKGQWIYTTTLSPTESWVLTDHKLYGKPLLVGTGYVDLLNKIADDIDGTRAVELRDLIFISPLLCKTDEPRKVSVVLTADEDDIKFKVESEEILDDGTSNWLVHAEGIMKFAEHKNLTVNIAELVQTYFNGNEIDVVFNRNEDGPISFGDRWDNERKASYTETNCLAYFSILDKYKNELASQKIQPAMLDNAVNVALHVLGDSLYLPWTYKSICVYDKMPDHFYSFLTLKEKDKHGEFAKFDVKLIDDKGKVFIEVKDYAIKKANSLELESSEPMPDVLSICFEKQELKENDYKEPANENIVLFYLSENEPDGLIGEFRQNGHSVLPYRLSKMEQSNFTGILSGLAVDKPVKFIFYANDYYDEFKNSDELKSILEKTLFSFFSFVRAYLFGKWKNADIGIVLIANDVYGITGQERLLQPHYACIFNIGKVACEENQELKCKALDIDENCDAKELYREIYSDNKTYYVALRQKQRYTMMLKQKKASDLPDREIKLKKNGVYIITGGTGGLGLVIAKHFASQENVNIVFVQRSKLPDRSEWDNTDGMNEKAKRAVEAIKEIESSGSTATLYSADVTNEEQVNTLLSSVRGKFGTISGVVHAAGLPGTSMIVNRKIEDFRNVINVKVLGAWLLDNGTKNDNLDFFIMFSSINSIFGGVGQSDYAAANSFMDAFAYFRNRRNPNTITINWAAWKETGMAVDFEVKDDQPIKQITTKGALQAFDFIMSKNVPQLWVGSINTKVPAIPEYVLPLSEELSRRYKPQKAKSNEQKPDVEVNKINTANINPDDVLPMVKSVWEKVLDVKDIDIYKSFSLLGGDSIIATYLVKEMGKKFGDIVNITDIYAYPSVSELSDHIKEVLTEGENSGESTEQPEETEQSTVEKEVSEPLSAEQPAVNVKAPEQNIKAPEKSAEPQKQVEKEPAENVNQVKKDQNSVPSRIIKFKNVDLINDYTWREFDCYARAIALMSEKIDLKLPKYLTSMIGIRRGLDLSGIGYEPVKTPAGYATNEDFAALDGVLKQFGLKKETIFVKPEKGICETIIEIIDKGQTVIVAFDEYYIFYNGYYRNKHSTHMVVVNGYDRNLKLFKIIDYNQIKNKQPNQISYAPFFAPFGVIEEIYSGFSDEFKKVVVLNQDKDNPVNFEQIKEEYIKILKYVSASPTKGYSLDCLEKVLNNESEYYAEGNLFTINSNMGGLDLTLRSFYRNYNGSKKEELKKYCYEIIKTSSDIMDKYNLSVFRHKMMKLEDFRKGCEIVQTMIPKVFAIILENETNGK